MEDNKYLIVNINALRVFEIAYCVIVKFYFCWILDEANTPFVTANEAIIENNLAIIKVDFNIVLTSLNWL